MTNEFNKFPSIGSFANVYHMNSKALSKSKVSYGAKIKLHGTNAAVRISRNEGVTAQSRTRDITPENDNAGFASWVNSNSESWNLPMGEGVDTVTVFGEWAGKGIQKKDAVTKLERKFFFVFSVEVDGYVITQPQDIEKIVPDLDDLLVLPWFDTFAPISFQDPVGCEDFSNKVSDAVEKIGDRDPFIYEVFGVEGPGEGLVLTPLNPENPSLPVPKRMYKEDIFKAKTAAHSVNKTAKPAKKEVTVPKGAKEFVDQFVTPARCEQALSEIGVERPTMRDLGPFLKWVGQDVKKESVLELEKSGLEWKDVSKYITSASKTWFQANCEGIV